MNHPARWMLVALLMSAANTAYGQSGNGFGVLVGAASPDGKLTNAFDMGSTIELFGIRKTSYDPVALRLGVSYTRLSASSTWHMSVTGVEPTIAYEFKSLPLTPSIFGGPGWYLIKDEATQRQFVNAVETAPHDFSRSAFGGVLGGRIEFTLKGLKVPIEYAHHAVPGFLSSGGIVKFNTLSIGLKF